MGIDTKRTDGDTRKHSVKEEVKVAEQERQEIMDEVIITTSGNLANLKTKVCNDLKNM